MIQNQWHKHLKDLAKEANEYFCKCKISPCGEEILEYVVSSVEAESGCDIDNEQYFSIASILGIDLDFI